MSLKTNVPAWDRALRLVIGFAVLSLRFWGPRSAWALLGVVPLATAVVGFCPAYTLVRAAVGRR